jgi:hypothetical protein
MDSLREILTIKDALSRATWTIKVPSMILMFGSWILPIMLMHRGVIPQYGAAGMWWLVSLFVLGFVLGWLVWSVQVPRWKLWAYARVRDISELKQKAIAAQIIWPDDSVFTRTEIMSKETRAGIRALESQAALNDT